jgi:hypothetical protein
MHSNWTLKLWTDENIKDLNFDNRDIFDKADNYGMKSDTLQYELLLIMSVYNQFGLLDYHQH